LSICPYLPVEVGRLLKENELIINLTSVGMAPNTDATPFDTSLLGAHNLVCDVGLRLCRGPRHISVLRAAYPVS
jgi:shikimate 5-dehydrogenase